MYKRQLFFCSLIGELTLRGISDNSSVSSSSSSSSERIKPKMFNSFHEVRLQYSYIGTNDLEIIGAGVCDYYLVMDLGTALVYYTDETITVLATVSVSL